MVLGDVGATVKLSRPSIPKPVGPLEIPKSTPKPSNSSSPEERVRAAKIARDRIKSTHASMKEQDPPLPPTINGGRSYVTYMQERFIKLYADIESECAKLEAEIKVLDPTKGDQGKKKSEKITQLNGLKPQKAKIAPILAKFAAELKKEPCGDGTVVWTNRTFFPALGELKEPSGKFFRVWKPVFTPEYLTGIRPFLEWDMDGKDGDLDKALAALETQKKPPKPEDGKRQPPPDKLEKDITSLGPFYIDLKAPDGTMIRLVNFNDGPSVNAAEPVKNPK